MDCTQRDIRSRVSNYARLLVLLAGFTVLAARAVIPENITYQGYLGDSAGAPVSAPVSVTFSLYNVSAGGVALWSDTRVVTPAGGLFSVQLGDGANPFPPDLFVEPLWMGIEVAGDGEMTPRRPLASVGYAQVANDALTLEGMNAGSLDQSAHVLDMSNPHNVTAAQIGVAGVADIALHAADPSAHHVKTSSFAELAGVLSDAQIPAGITRDSELAGHAGDASAHHTPVSSLPWNSITGLPAGFADNVDNDSGGDITGVVAGTGLNGGGAAGNVILNIDVPLALIGSSSGILSANNQAANVTLSSGVYGLISSTSPGALSAGVRGENRGTAGSGTGVYGSHAGSGWGVYGTSVGGRGVFGTSSSGQGVYGSSTNGTAGYFSSSSGYGLVVNSGNAGMGTVAPNSKLHVNGNGVTPTFRAQVAGNTRLLVAPNGSVAVGGNITNPAARFQVINGSDATLSNGSGYTVIGSESSLNLVIDNNEIMARSNGAASKLFLNKDSSFVVVPGLEITGGADLVEPFDVGDGSERVEPGMVLAIDPENPGKLRVARSEYDRTVAGIVSGANGIQPGLSMSHQGTRADGAYPVALTGRLYALADAAFGAIEPGDLLTTSSTPGHVRKVSDHSRAQGAIIGKAMTALEQGQGYVLVLVSLQ